LLTAALFFFLCQYQLLIHKNQTEIDHLYDTIPVSALIETTDFLNDSFTIDFTYIEELANSGFVKSYDIEMQYLAYPYLPNIEWKTYNSYIDGEVVEVYDSKNQSRIYGVSTLEDTRDIPVDLKVTFGKGYSEEDLRGDKAVCIIELNQRAQNGIKHGDTIWLLGEAVTIDIAEADLEGLEEKEREARYKELYEKAVQELCVPFTVIGSYVYDDFNLADDTFRREGFQSGDYIVGSTGFMNVIEDYFISEQEDLTPYGGIYWGLYDKKAATSVDFLLQNTKDLATLRKLASSMGMVSRFSVKGIEHNVPLKLTIRDQDLRQAVNGLEVDLRLKTKMIPLIFILIGVIGFILSYLAVQTRSKELMLMHILGKKKWKILIYVVEEQFLLCILGFLIAMLILILNQVNIIDIFNWVLLVGYIVMYLLGIVFAAIALMKSSTMQGVKR